MYVWVQLPSSLPKTMQMELLSQELKNAVVEEIREGCRDEAISILELADDKDREDFLNYHKENQGNICCLVLDFAKKKLIEAGKMERDENECFHDPYEWFDDEKTE